jgi:hypothetical protein
MNENRGLFFPLFLCPTTNPYKKAASPDYNCLKMVLWLNRARLGHEMLDCKKF